MKQLDVHGLTLIQAKRVIDKEIDELYKRNVQILYINHGFNNGSKIKTYCKYELIKNEKVIRVESGENEGISKVYLKLNLKNDL